jgi:hypothetical protein
MVRGVFPLRFHGRVGRGVVTAVTASSEMNPEEI